MCITGKVYHISRKAAQSHVDGLRKKTGFTPDVYLCRHCGFYHVGFSRSQRSKMSGGARRDRKRQRSKRHAPTGERHGRHPKHRKGWWDE